MFSMLSQGVRQRFGQGLASVLACVAVSAGAAAPAEGLNLTAQQVAALGVASVPVSQSAQGGLTVPAQLRLPAQLLAPTEN